MQEIINSTDLIFAGKVIDKSRELWIGDNYDVEFQLSEIYKGQSESKAFIKTGARKGQCGFPFVVGESYLVFAYRQPESEKENSTTSSQIYTTSICSLTKTLQDAQADLRNPHNIK
ncbi:MAG: hypothetical protein EOO07_30085 [Chitinophagaceae bacterium]|nr:MAG: hypothetical protein EOO07_30085 [Chitinophagaceae bacterium]